MATSTLNRDAQFSTLSNAAYLSSPPEKIGDWVLIKQSDSSTSGFSAVAYKNNFTNEVALSFRGTDGISDLRADLTFVAGGWSPQFSEAAKFTADIKNQLLLNGKGQAYEFYSTGHSLGGGIAQIIAKMFALNGSSFEAPGAQKVVDNAMYAVIKAQYAPDSSGKIGTDFTNYRAEGSVISGISSSIGLQVNMVNLTQAGAVRFIGVALTVAGVATGGLGGLISAALGYAGVNVDSTHVMDGIERMMYIGAGLEKALGTGALKMSTVPLSQATGQKWLNNGAEPQVVIFQDSGNRVKAYIQPDGQGWKLATPDQQASITLTPSLVPGQAPICIVKEVNKPDYSCVMTEKDGAIIRTIDNNGDGKADQFNLELDINKDGKLDKFISSGNNQSTLLDTDWQLNSLYHQGLLSNDIWNNYTSWSTSQLVGSNSRSRGQVSHSNIR